MYRGSLWPDVFNDANGVRLVSKSEGKQSIWANWKTQLQYIVIRDKEQSWRLYHSHFFFLKGPESSSSASICSRHLCLWLVLMAEQFCWLPLMQPLKDCLVMNIDSLFDFLLRFAFREYFHVYNPLASYWTC